ncbi:MAG: type IV toxin-antitoxin system AbiEi family antitoxin [Planctomycetota bacterium]
MSRRVRKEAMPLIDSFFDKLPRSIFKRSELGRLLEENRGHWGVAASTTAQQFIELLLSETRLHEIRLEFPPRPEIRFAWGDASIYQLLMSLNRKAYCSHYTAMVLHGLTEQIPKTWYVNIEQPAKPKPPGELSQSGIDAALRRAPRKTKRIALYDDQRICVLNGMQTGNLGVVEMTAPDGAQVRVTNIERTLIDITVRACYSGGVFEVAKAFEAAKGTASINKLAAMLKKLDYVYPYYQAVGFYVERAGYRDAAVDLLRKFEMKYDFYLDHGLKDKAYAKTWRLYVPKGL